MTTAEVLGWAMLAVGIILLARVVRRKGDAKSELESWRRARHHPTLEQLERADTPEADPLHLQEATIARRAAERRRRTLRAAASSDHRHTTAGTRR